MVKKQTVVPLKRRVRMIHIEEVARRASIHPELIARLVALGLVEPRDNRGQLFAPETVARVQRILRLRRDLGVNYNGIALVLDLLEQIEALETRLKRAEG